jgi:hypothetical protein
MPDGRNIPPWLDAATVALALFMLPACAMIPVPLLLGGRRQLRRVTLSRGRWTTAWTVAASLAVGVEGVFLFRLIRFLMIPFANLAQPSWHALDFSVVFAATGGLMAVALLGAFRSARKSPSAGP